jgi:hypothetical protein
MAEPPLLKEIKRLLLLLLDAAARAKSLSGEPQASFSEMGERLPLPSPG